MGVLLSILSNPLLYVGIGLAAAVIVAVKLEFTEVRANRSGESRGVVRRVVEAVPDILVGAILIFIVFLIGAFPITLASLWPRVAHAMVNPLWRCLGLIFLFGLALAVNLFKTEFLRLYAVVEVLVGLMIAWGALAAPAVKGGGLFQGVALAGSVYALVAGIGDFLKGVEESKKSWFDRGR